MKTSKVLLLTLALVLVIGIAVGVISSAEDAKTPDIISQNVRYDEVFSLMYAIDAASVNEAPVILNLYYDDPADGAEIKKTYTASEPQIERIDGEDTLVYVFITEGVAAKALTQNFYVQAVDNTGAESEVVRYSVLEYLNVRLYGGQTITESQKALYEDVISFASSAQRVLINEKDSDTTNDIPLASTYSLVEIKDGIILEDVDATRGYDQGVYPEGTKVYPYREGFTGKWNVITAGGSTQIDNGAEVTVNGYTKIVEYVPNVPGDYYVNYGGLSYDDITYIKAYEVSGNINRATYQVQDPNTESAYTDARDYIVLNTEDTNNYMKFATKESEQGQKASIYILGTNTNEGNCLVFETKIKVSFDATTAAACAANSVPQVMYLQVAKATPNNGSCTNTDVGVASSGFARIYAKADDEGELHYYINHTNFASDANILNADAEITEGWHTYTVEMYENGFVKSYVDGKLVGTSKCISNADLNGTGSNGFIFSDANAIKIQFANSSIGGDIDNSAVYFDNTFLGRVNKAYVAE